MGIDADFNDCIDGLVLVDLACLTPAKRKRYLGVDEAPPALAAPASACAQAVSA